MNNSFALLKLLLLCFGQCIVIVFLTFRCSFVRFLLCVETEKDRSSMDGVTNDADEMNLKTFAIEFAFVLRILSP